MKIEAVKISMAGVLTFAVLSLVLFSIQSCDSGQNNTDEKEVPKEEQNVVEVSTNMMEFDMVGELPSGWHTFEYANNSQEVHFFLLNKYPEGKTIEDGKAQVVPVFQKGMDLINEGNAEEGFEAFGELPEWFSEVLYSGGVGLISPGETGITTIHLEPGYYVMECYIKMATGIFHTTMGMIHELVVTEEDSGNSPPEADVDIAISSEEGISMKGPVNEGRNTFSVYFEDQTTHENFVGHDVNLVKLHHNADLEELEKWMNWADPEGLITPSPESITFLGGANDMAEGSTAYFTAELDPGNYALISEVPNARDKNMLKLFEVPPAAEY